MAIVYGSFTQTLDNFVSVQSVVQLIHFILQSLGTKLVI